MLPIWILVVGLSIGTFGKVLLGVTVIRVHSKIVKEHKLDGKVFTEMKEERLIGIWSIVLMIIGFLFEILFYLA